MQASASRKDAYDLMFEGALALSKIQSNGIKIDVDYLEQTKKDVVQKREEEHRKFQKLKDVAYWMKRYGSNFNVGSDDQLAHVLFDYLQYKPKKKTDTGKPSVDVNVLEELLEETKNPMLKSLMYMRKLEKAYGTYLQGIARETGSDGILRPFFNLHLAVSFRSSSNSPNFQNIPIRDDEIKKLIRNAFIPRKGRQIAEFDFKGIEVQTAYFYHRDPVMKSFLTDKKKDMHSMSAMKCYLLKEDEWNSKTRHAGKNKFVFPEFYGSYWEQTAEDLWKAIALNKLRIGKDNGGVSLYVHLKNKGIYTLDDFAAHIQQVEDWFWNEQFTVYTQWKKDWYSKYLKRGYFDSLTGFRYQGILKRNEVINYAVQGSAFHCLLRTLIQLQTWLEDNNMESLIIGQIHDSIVMDLVPEEKDVVIPKLLNIINKELPKWYPWIDVPMSIEAELAPVDEPWLNKKEISLEQYT